MNLVADLRQQLVSLDLTVEVAAEEQLVWLLQEMLRWNRTHNLTAISDPLEGIEKHLVDSLTLLPFINEGASLLDIGSGAGFPGLPLKIARPSISVVSVDSVAKKISFQKHAVRKLKLDCFLAWHGRAENLPTQPFCDAQFDFIVARAFSSIQNLVELALPCLRPEGRIIAMKGPEAEHELAEAGPWLENNGVRCLDLIRLALPASQSVRQLLILGR